MYKILVVDDALFIRSIVKGYLTENNFEVVAEAQNGKEALAKYIETCPDIVTMDITMPEMDGIETIKQIKKHDSKAKIVICSAMGQEHMVIKALKAGAVDFVVKPLDKERVLAAINKALTND
ncbi:two-component system chemotaxis response regulator CheY [Aneurinibacillus soli]|uniref:Chemotaxis protein CheY n=1 Tax=Aneurinibacillus soli TaxID=1500254 RepID=A0A0U4NM18_9BACL|nr:response regulator [Aneurinibacillus soli]PYE61884.1 two-component system chemotaxis response regulator CheY [Aneurinibacillus soli]BAU29700.1 Chemotaxis protein CheY [Aneurinibacillus soli]